MCPTARQPFLTILIKCSLVGRPVSCRLHSKWWWCHDIGYPLLAAEHSPYKAPWSGTPCRTTSVHSMSPLDSAWKPGFSLATSVLSTLQTSWQLRYINLHLPCHSIPYHTIALFVWWIIKLRTWQLWSRRTEVTRCVSVVCGQSTDPWITAVVGRSCEIRRGDQATEENVSN